MAKDSLGNEQTTLSSVTVKTVRTTPPVFQELLVQYNAPASVYVEVSFAACIMHPAAVDEAAGAVVRDELQNQAAVYYMLRLACKGCRTKQPCTTCWDWHAKSAPTATMGHIPDSCVESCTDPNCVACVSLSTCVPARAAQ